RRGGREDCEGRERDARDVDFLVRERQGYEAEEVDRPDEDHQGRDVWEPTADGPRRQPLLRHLDLRDLVDRLAERLTLRRLTAELDPHEDEPEKARAERAEQEVRDRLVDRHVERADVDR